ncbi:hypothetical protein NEMBOFW57_006674 [Staphylotrichum longicolle]|uniref:Yeast cell wall synthesis Kre9/Knh1-like N-terminal domain-containing protein n=1 Tax=Staphylotrichum longicolle TaxID=669026 RepID=A0AAD4ETS2_9PEZI|nr:hypothetical protein NEMBOFW57_006674 [Staphylotrichum longicolle]
MRFSFAAVFALVAPTLVAAQTSNFNLISKPTSGETIPTGSRYEIVWQPSSSYPGAVTLVLIGGATTANLNSIVTIAKGVDGSAGSYSWQVPTDVGNLAVYGIRMSLDSDTRIFQYSAPFKFSSGGGSGGGGGNPIAAPTTSSTPKPDPPSSSSPAPKPPTSSNSPDTSTPTSAASSDVPDQPGFPRTVVSSTSSSSSQTTTASDRDGNGNGPSRSTSLASSTSGSASDLPTETNTGAPQALGGSSSSGLSSGAVIGIAVGVSLAVLVLAAVAFLVFYRRRRRRNSAGGPDPSIGELDDDPRGPPDTAELAAEKGIKDVPELAVGAAAVPAASEMSGESPAPRVPEMSGESPAPRVPELGGSLVTAPVELAQDPRSNDAGPAPPVEISPVEVPGPSSPIASHPPAAADQAVVGDLLARQSRLDERRQRLLELEQIDQERDAIQRQISVLQQQQQQPAQRYEMGG